MFISRLLCLAIALLLALPPGIGTSPVEPGGLGNAPGVRAAPQSAEPAASVQGQDPAFAGKRKARKSRKARKRSAQSRDNKERKAESRKNRKKKDREVQARPESRAARDTAGTAPTGTGAGDCGPGLFAIGDTGLCTHGPDPEPPNLELDLARSAAAAREIVQESVGLSCVGDGQSGPRVQVIYAYDTSRGSRYDHVVGTIRMTAAGADDIMRESSIAGGKELHFRFVQDAQCNIDVQPVGFSTAAMQDFVSMIGTMHGGSQNRTDRIYLIFADTTSAGICGVGTMVRDDRPTQANRNNFGPSYSRIDQSCWAPHAATHELLHNLGGVQHSAPNSSGANHCIDEWDVLCYADHPYAPALKYACPDQATFQNRIDCNYDDYFHPLPPAGSYLDTHWNTANSVFLHTGPGMCGGPAQSCIGTIALEASRSSVKNKKRLRLSATLTGATARSSTVSVRACKGNTCSWEAGKPVATLSAASPSTKWKAKGKGKVTFVAQVTSSNGVVTSNLVTVTIKKAKKKR